MRFLFLLLISFSSVFSGSVHFPDLVLHWHYDQVYIQFLVTFTVPSAKTVDWWSVSISQELDHRTDVFLFNTTGLDGRFALSDCTNDLDLFRHEGSDPTFITEFRRTLNATEGCYIKFEPGKTYIFSTASGLYHESDLIETSASVPTKTVLMTNQFTDEEEMGTTLNYVIGVSGFVAFLYIAA